MRRKRREWQEASISFLDVISCGFGAIVLLLVIARVGDPMLLVKAEKALMGSVRAMQKQLFEIRGDYSDINEQYKSANNNFQILISE